jgi:hypothetical protein
MIARLKASLQRRRERFGMRRTDKSARGNGHPIADQGRGFLG